MIICPHCLRPFDPTEVKEARDALDEKLADLYAAGGKTYKQIGAEMGMSGARVAQRVNRYEEARREEIRQALKAGGISLDPSMTIDTRGRIRLYNYCAEPLSLPPPPFDAATLDAVRSYIQQVEQKRLARERQGRREQMQEQRRRHVIRIKSTTRRLLEPGQFFDEYDADGTAVFSNFMSYAHEFNSAAEAKEFWQHPWRWKQGSDQKHPMPRVRGVTITVMSIAEVLAEQAKVKREGWMT